MDGAWSGTLSITMLDNTEAGDGSFQIVRTGDTSSSLVVNYILYDGTATRGTGDFLNPYSNSLSFADVTIPAGETVSPRITVDFQDDSEVEGTENYSLLAWVPGVTSASATGTIYDMDTPESAKSVFGLICCVVSGVFLLNALAYKWVEFYDGTEVVFDGDGIRHRFAFRREKFVSWDSLPCAVVQHMQQRVKVDNLGFAARLGFGPIGRILYEVLTPTTYRYFDALLVKSDTIQVSHPVDDLTAERLQNWLCSRQISVSVNDWGGSVKWGEFGLTEIDVGGTKITDAQFQPIASEFDSLKELRRLNLNGTRLTNDIFAHFGPSSTLQEIDHIGTAISREEVAAVLEQAPPDDKM